MDTHVVIMAGGIGSRLWPVSTPQKPKQFIDLLGIGKTLIQMTVERFLPVCNKENFWVVTSASYVGIVKEQLPDIPASHILAEPEPRNTAPCIAYACWKIHSVNPDANIVVTPADALVINVQKFAAAIRKALNTTDGSNRIVTVGVAPTRPDTGYGYICAEEKNPDEVVKVREFKEKPDRRTAKEYLKAGNYFWNAGIFIWNAKTIISQIRAYAPQIAGVMDRIAASFGTWKEEEIEKVVLAELIRRGKQATELLRSLKRDDYDVSGAKKEIADLKRELTSKYMAYVRKEISQEDYIAFQKEVRAKTAELEGRITVTRGSNEHLEEVEDALKPLADGSVAAEKNGLTQAMVQELVENVWVGDEITVEFKADSIMQIAEDELMR